MLKLTNTFCEALICGEWRLIPVESILGEDGIIRRCPECHAAVKLMKEGKDGQRPHFDHDKKNPECSLGKSVGKQIKYDHVSVKVAVKDVEDSVKFENLLPHCMDRSEVINDGDACEDIIDVQTTLLSDSEKRQEINARVGQGKFRQEVIRVWGSETCALTLTPVKEMLIASHIKAWRNCESSAERLDGVNGILLCAHVAGLFDKHRITFKKVGREFRLKLADDLDKTLMAQLGINGGDALATGRMNKADFEKFGDYLAHHENIFNQLNDVNMA